LGIRTRNQFAEHIENVINNPTQSGALRNGREYFYDRTTNTIVIRNPRAADGGTAFRPVDPDAYLKNLR
jgi:filamentous hemagglutinin